MGQNNAKKQDEVSSRSEVHHIPLQRQSSLVSKHRKVSRHASVRKATSFLNVELRKRIQTTWTETQVSCNKTVDQSSGSGYGMLVFKNVFISSPELLPVFQIEKDDDLDHLPENHPFLRHSNVFTNIIDLAVRNIDELELQITPALLTYGRRHYYKERIGFTTEYAQIFSDSMIHVLHLHLVDDWNDELQYGWTQLVQYIMAKMKEGYELEAMYRKKTGKWF